MDASLHNFNVYVLQVALVVAAAGLAASLFRLAMPRGRLSYWRAVVFVCLTLPLLPARRVEHVDVSAPPAAIATGIAAAAANLAPATAPTQNASAGRRLLALLPWMLFAGMAGRALWLGIGLTRLSRLRRRAQPAMLDEDVLVLQRALAPHAQLRWHEHLAQPVTFGLRRPVVLLPSRLATLPLDIQRAVVCHELLHVGRHDWLWTLAEESVRTLFWFHPAMRWALAQVQLNREETVDRLAVAITGARRSYMNALMMFAAGSDEPMLAPATSFVRRRQLVLRMTAISQEVRMSPLRLAITGLALAAALVGSSWAVVSAVPLHASVPGITSTSADVQLPITASAPVERAEPVPPQATTQPAPAAEARLRQRLDEVRSALGRLRMVSEQAQTPTAARTTRTVIKEVKPQYPPDFMRLGLSAEVTLSVTISAAGDVTDVEAASWSMRTTKSDAARTNEAATAAAQPFVDAAKAAARQWKFAPADSDTSVEISFTFTTRSDAHIVGNVIESSDRGVPGGVIGGVGTGAGAGVGVGGGVPGGIGDGVASPRMPGFGATAARPGQIPATTTVKVVRVGGTIRAPRKFSDVRPVYPDDARAAGVQGVVIIEARIATDGSIADARILRSIPMLDQAALDAVRRWRYEPTLLNGEAVEVIMTVTVDFTQP